MPERGCSLSLVWHPALCPGLVPGKAPSAPKHLSEPPKGQRLCCAPTHQQHPPHAATWRLSSALLSTAVLAGAGAPSLMSPMELGPSQYIQTAHLQGHVGASPWYQAEKRVCLSFCWPFPAGIAQAICRSGSTVPGGGDPWPFLPVGPWARPPASLDLNN